MTERSKFIMKDTAAGLGLGLVGAVEAIGLNWIFYTQEHLAMSFISQEAGMKTIVLGLILGAAGGTLVGTVRSRYRNFAK